MQDIDGPRTSAVQRAWLIDEIVRNILAHVPLVGSSKTLANCARVSTALSEPALDMLWSRMTGLSPLCQLLDEYPADENTSYLSTTIPHNAIDDAGWSRFTHYARRVRKLHYHCREGPSERLSQRTFAAIVRRASRAGAPLLPRLEELSWLHCARDITPYLHFLSPSLRRVTVYVQVGGSDPAPPPLPSPLDPQQQQQNPSSGFLSLLDAQSPQVEELSLEGIALPASLEPLLAFRRLRSLRLGTVACPVAVVVSYCGAMPTLASLSVDLSCSPATSASASPAHDHPHTEGDAPALRALEDLRVAGAPSLIEELLRSVPPGALRSASLSVLVPGYDQDGAARCTGVLSTRFRTSLQRIRVHYRHATDRLPHTTPLFARAVQPLLAIRGLRECTLAFEDSAPAAMTDADVREMAEAWPMLSLLEVALCRNPYTRLCGSRSGTVILGWMDDTQSTPDLVV
ncbi:hypothetical protein VTO73DRAFT_12641 [Trametes versicolor]